MIRVRNSAIPQTVSSDQNIHVMPDVRMPRRFSNSININANACEQDDNELDDEQHQTNSMIMSGKRVTSESRLLLKQDRYWRRAGWRPGKESDDGLQSTRDTDHVKGLFKVQYLAK